MARIDFNVFLMILSSQVLLEEIQLLTILYSSITMKDYQDPKDALDADEITEATVHVHSLDAISRRKDDAFFTLHNLLMGFASPFHRLSRFTKAAVRGELKKIEKIMKAKVERVATFAIELVSCAESTLKWEERAAPVARAAATTGLI